MGNKISEQEASRRRRVINTALKGVLTSTETLQAIDIWEKNFYSSPSLRIPSFINKAQEGLDFSDEIKRELLQRLTKSLASPLESLEPDPFQKPEGTKEELVGEYVIFDFLLSTLLAKLENQDIKLLQNNLLDSLPDTNLSATGKQKLSKWCTSLTTGNAEKITSSFKPAEMSETLDLLYDFFCEALGPVKTDQIFAEAIRNAESLPEASNFSPKQLF